MPHRVKTVKRDASGPHIIYLDDPTHCNTVQTSTGHAEASAPTHLVNHTKHQLNHPMEDPQVFQEKTGAVW
jgi:hypothetical protein